MVAAFDMAWIKLTGPRAETLESTFRDALRGLAGSWTIDVTEGLVGGWSLMAFRRDDGVERTLLMSPLEQSAEQIREGVRGAFRTVPRRAPSELETTQSTLEGVAFWATGLQPIYFEGAFDRAYKRTVNPRP